MSNVYEILGYERTSTLGSCEGRAADRCVLLVVVSQTACGRTTLLHARP